MVHVLANHVRAVREKFGDRGEVPLFPTEVGDVCTKAGVVETIRKLVEGSGDIAKDSGGNWIISGHTFRITGARTLSKWGLDPITIQLIGRWGSMAGLTYLSEAPLDGFHRRLESPLTAYDARAHFDRVDTLTGLNLKAQVQSIVAEQAKADLVRKEQLQHIHDLEQNLSDMSHQLDGICHVLDTHESGREVWKVLNEESKALRQAVVFLDMPTCQWRTLCGWSFAGKPHVSTSRPGCTEPQGFKKCPKCHPCSPTSVGLPSSASSSED